MKNQRGEIATVLKQIVKKLLDFFAGEFSEEIQKQGQGNQPQTNTNHRSNSKFIKIYHSVSTFSSNLIANIINKIAKIISPVNIKGSLLPMANSINPAERSEEIEEATFKWRDFIVKENFIKMSIMKAFMPVKKCALPKNSRGEIATVLTLISVGLMLMGVVVGNVAVQKQTQLQSQAGPDDNPTPNPTYLTPPPAATATTAPAATATTAPSPVATTAPAATAVPTPGTQITPTKTIANCDNFSYQGQKPCDNISGCGWMHSGKSQNPCNKCVPIGIDPDLVCPKQSIPSSNCVYRNPEECTSFGCAIDNCKSCIQSDGSAGYKCSPSGQTCSQSIPCGNKFLKTNNNQMSQDAEGLYHKNATCLESGYSIESSEIRSYCGVAAAQASPCTSCVGDKCIYHPEIDLRSGRADPGVTQCTDTGCVSDSECATNTTCRTNTQSCGEKNQTCCDEGTKLRCNAQNKCEPIPLEQPKCEDFYDKDNSKAQTQCKDACGSRGCEQVPFIGGYVTNCWRCNTKQYCGKFGNEACAVGAGKPTPILGSKKSQNIGQSSTCTLIPGINVTDECANCIIGNDPWVVDNRNGLPKLLQDSNKVNSDWKKALKDNKCTKQDLARYWCKGGDGDGNTDNQTSINQCKSRYLDASPNLPGRQNEPYRACATLCTVYTNSSRTGITTPSCNLERGNLDFTQECSGCILGKRNEWITSKKISSTIPAPGPIRLRDNIQDSCNDEQVIEYWCSGKDGQRGSAADCKKSIDECNSEKNNVCKTTSTTAGNTTCNIIGSFDSPLPSACVTCIMTNQSTTATVIPAYSIPAYSNCDDAKRVNKWCADNKNNGECTKILNALAANNKCNPNTACQKNGVVVSPPNLLAYSNEGYEAVIAAIKAGQLTAIDASLYVLNATRVPGLQRLFCDPFKGQCDFYYQNPQAGT